MAKSKRTDWYPRGRANQLARIKRWITVLNETADGEPPKGRSNREVWDVSLKRYTALAEAYGTAVQRFDEVVISGAREGPIAEAATLALNNMEKAARDFRNKEILGGDIPPEGLFKLGEHEKDTSRNRPDRPERTVNVVLSNPALHTILAAFSPGPGEQDVSGFTFNCRVGILSPSGKYPERSTKAHFYMSKVPLVPEDFPVQENRSRRFEKWDFTNLEAGMTVYFAIAYENSRHEIGPWVIVSAIIT